jgi:hypothetical protein
VRRCLPCRNPFHGAAGFGNCVEALYCSATFPKSGFS